MMTSVYLKIPRDTCNTYIPVNQLAVPGKEQVVVYSITGHKRPTKVAL